MLPVLLNAQSAGTSPLVITNVTVIDPRDGRASPGMSVVVRGGRIESVERSVAAQERGATIVDGRGKFLVPGFWDMETHLSWTTESALPILVANGITSVRDMGGAWQQLVEWRTQIMEGTRVGPSILTVGPMLNGKSFNQWQLATGDTGQTRGVVRALKFLGVDGLNLERRVERDSYFALMSEAKLQNLRVGGHVPITVTAREATDAGQSTIENAETLLDGMFTGNARDEDIPAAVPRFLLSGAADSLFREFVKNGIAVTPVLYGFENAVDASDPASPVDPREKYVAASQRGFYKKAPMPAAELTTMRRIVPGLIQIVQRMHQDGVTLLAGTDIAGPRVPGFSLHEELRTLVSIGLSPLEALQTATINPARVLGKNADCSTIEKGKVADLVLLDADPRVDIANTERIAAVVLRGKLFDRQALAALLRDGELLAKTH
ncbi:MAG: amidohydrolase family protein [Gemmatimonadaceae bacterium]